MNIVKEIIRIAEETARTFSLEQPVMPPEDYGDELFNRLCASEYIVDVTVSYDRDNDDPFPHFIVDADTINERGVLVRFRVFRVQPEGWLIIDDGYRITSDGCREKSMRRYDAVPDDEET